MHNPACHCHHPISIQGHAKQVPLVGWYVFAQVLTMNSDVEPLTTLVLRIKTSPEVTPKYSRASDAAVLVPSARHGRLLST